MTNFGSIPIKLYWNKKFMTSLTNIFIIFNQESNSKL